MPLRSRGRSQTTVIDEGAVAVSRYARCSELEGDVPPSDQGALRRGEGVVLESVGGDEEGASELKAAGATALAAAVAGAAVAEAAAARAASMIWRARFASTTRTNAFAQKTDQRIDVAIVARRCEQHAKPMAARAAIR